MWFFYSPNIIYGEDALNFLENISGDKCFIVTDKNLEELGYLKILTDKLDQLGKNYEIFTDVDPDPKEKGVLTAKEICISYAPDLIIGLGGGSVMDTAKAVWALYEFPDYSITDIHPFQRSLYDLGKKAKMICIPTTSGTGAETTMIVIISRFEDNVWKKYEQAHKGLIPTYAIVDPVFPAGMPPKLTIYTAFDALAHAFESYINLWKNEFSNALCLKVIELIFKYLPIVVKDGNNMEARDLMHQAATISGLAIGNASGNLSHAMGHSLGSVFHTIHGTAVGIYLPYNIQYCLNNPDENDKTTEILGILAKRLGWANWNEDINKAAYIVIDKIKELQKEVNFPTRVQDLGISREEYDNNLNMLINLCYQSAFGTMNLRSVNAEDLRKLFTYSYEGQDIDF